MRYLVPSRKTPRRNSRVVNIDPTVTRWHATGMYAAPGEVVTLSVPNRVIDAGMRLRIGGHTDDIGVRQLVTTAMVHWHYAIDAPQIQAASPFGGALYIDVGTSNQGIEPFAALIDDAVEAPYFVLGETSDDSWNETIRNAPAPYAGSSVNTWPSASHRPIFATQTIRRR